MVRVSAHDDRILTLTLTECAHTGRQHLGALFNLIAYYVLALPMGITLAFHPKTHLGLQGLWIGACSNLSSTVAIALIVL